MLSPRWTATVAGLVLITVHLVTTAGHGLTLPESVRETVGASPETTTSRPWALFTAPFFHDGLFHLTYNLAVLALVLPVALGAVGPGRGLSAAYLASPVGAAFVNLALILPLAGAGWAYAQAAVEPRLVGASIAIFAAAGMALVTRPWATQTIVAVGAAYVAYEVLLAATGITRPFVGIYHVTGFGLGLALGPWLATYAG